MGAWMIPAMSAAGTFLGGLGQFAGSMMGDDEKVKLKNMYHEEDVRRSIKHRFKYSREFGQQYGFHPLLGLGINPAVSGSRPIKVGDNKGSKLAGMGQGLNKMLSAGQSELTKAQIENMKANTNLINKKAEQIGKDAPEGQGQGIVETNLGPVRDRSLEPGIKALENVYTYKNKFGENVLEFLPSQDAADYLSESWWDNWKYRIQKEAKGFGQAFKRIDYKDANLIRDRLNKLEDSHPPRAGYYYAFNFLHGRPIEIKIDKYKGERLFDSKSFNTPRRSGFQNWRNKPRRRY